MLNNVRVLAAVFALVSAVGCDSSGGGAAATGSAKSGPAAPVSAAATAKPTAAAPEMDELKNEKRKLSFKAPKGTKADAGGESYTWDTMQIIVESTMEPVAKHEDLMKIVPGSGKEGAAIEATSEGEVLISSWREKDGPAHAVCGQKGKSAALRLSFEPDHKSIALAMCKSLRVE
jgi:hypothetical protein